MRILGLSAYYHDAAVALVVDGRIAFAAQEERFTRRKHDAAFPHEAIRSCLETTGVKPGDIDIVAFYDKPFLKFERLLETYLAFAPQGFHSFREALPVWVKDKLFQRTTILKELKQLDPRAGRLEARADRVHRERGVVLLAREALLLRGGHDRSVAHQRGRGVVVIGGDAEDLHPRRACR